MSEAVTVFPRSASADHVAYPSLKESTRTWLRVALLSFGGPAGQIAVMHRIIVEEKRWLSEQRFLHALNYCMLLPGPEAQQLATYVGWLMHRTVGGLIAGGLFILPGMICIMALSYVYALWGQVPVVTALLFGLKAAVLAIVVEAVIRIGKRSLKSRTLFALAATAFIGIFFFAVPFPVIILTAGLLGLMGLVRASPISHGASTTNSVSDEQILFGDELTQSERPSIARTVRVAAIWLSLRLRGRKSLRALRALDLSPAMFLSSQNATLRR
jgi:chromate transporter